MCLTQNLSVQLARIDIKENYVFEPESDESFTKGMVNQSKREGNALYSPRTSGKRVDQFVCPRLGHMRGVSHRMSTQLRAS